MTTVTELGKTFSTKRDFRIISDSEFNNFKKQWYEKPSYDKLVDNILLLKDGGQDISTITEYFYRDIMDDTRVFNTKFTINEVINNKVLLSYAIDTTLQNKKVYDGDIVTNVDTSFRLRGGHFARKATQFPIYFVDFVLDRYALNNNYLDTSCGWGSRLASALRNGFNYFGTDPNDKLVPRLNDYYNEYIKIACVGKTNKPKIDIRCQGSEIFIPEWKKSMGVMFTSPPYFSLEDYSHGEGQSYKVGTTYEMWLENFLCPTMKNVYEYLIDNACMIINIKDFGNFSLEADTIRCADKCGFYLFDTMKLSQKSDRPHPSKEVDCGERVFVFCRKGEKHSKKRIEQQNLFDLF